MTRYTMTRRNVTCHQYPWKEGCTNGIVKCRGGADRDNRRYSYECSCGSKWNQTRPALLSPGENPQIRSSTRATRASDIRRSGGYTKTKRTHKNLERSYEKEVKTCEDMSEYSVNRAFAAGDTGTHVKVNSVCVHAVKIDTHHLFASLVLCMMKWRVPYPTRSDTPTCG